MTGESRQELRPGSRKPPSAVVGCFLQLVAAGAMVIVFFAFCGLFARHSWRCEQASHFCVQYFWLLLPATIVLLAARRWRLGAIAGAAALLNLAFVVPIYWPADQPAAGGPPFRLISYNVLSHNQRYEEVLAFLRQEQADAVLLMEINSAWAERLESLDDIYPCRHIVARDDNFGIALLSRAEFREIETREFGTAGVPSIVAKLDLAGQTLTLIGTHPLPPGSARMAAQRNEQLADVAEFARQQSSAVVLAGDLNVTSYSPYFTDLLAGTKLRDSRQGIGVQASWAPRLPVLEIPIDHCLVSRQVHVASRRVGPHFGSDHRPVIVEMSVSSAE